jgi:hypothetical protein
MRKTTMLACMVALGMAAAPAFADCQADIKAAEEAATRATDAAQKSSAESHIRMARDELAKANEKACAEHVAAAKQALNKPAMQTP